MLDPLLSANSCLKKFENNIFPRRQISVQSQQRKCYSNIYGSCFTVLFNKFYQFFSTGSDNILTAEIGRKIGCYNVNKKGFSVAGGPQILGGRKLPKLKKFYRSNNYNTHNFYYFMFLGIFVFYCMCYFGKTVTEFSHLILLSVSSWYVLTVFTRLN